MKKNFEAAKKIDSLADWFNFIICKIDKSDFEFNSLNQATKRDFWFASKEFADSF